MSTIDNVINSNKSFYHFMNLDAPMSKDREALLAVNKLINTPVNPLEEADSIVDDAIAMLELEELWNREMITEAQLSFIQDLEG